jgi:hypothetical protein
LIVYLLPVSPGLRHFPTDCCFILGNL